MATLDKKDGESLTNSVAISWTRSLSKLANGTKRYLTASFENQNIQNFDEPSFYIYGAFGFKPKFFGKSLKLEQGVYVSGGDGKTNYGVGSNVKHSF